MGHDSDELWLFDSESRTWAQLKDTRTGSGGSDAHTAQPGPRYFHSAVVDAERGSMLLAGRFAKRCVYEAGELRELAYDSEASGSDNVPLWEWDFGAKQWALHTAQLEGQEGLGGLSGVCVVLEGGDRGAALVLGGHSYNARGPHKGDPRAQLCKVTLAPKA
eukprot:2793606-Rhodomonas_salina.1